MSKIKWILPLITFITIVTGCKVEKNNELVMLAIDAVDYKNDSLVLMMESGSELIKLDSNGQGEIEFPLSNIKFAEIFHKEYDRKAKVLLKPSDKLALTIKGKELYYSGEGSPENNLLFETEKIKNLYFDSLNQIYDSHYSAFISLWSFIDSKIITLYDESSTKFSKSYSGDIEKLLKNDFKAFLLYEKHNLLYNFSKKEIDSLELEKKLGIHDLVLFKDSLLLSSNSIELKNYLRENLYYNYNNKVYSEELNPKENLLLFHRFLDNQSSLYHKSILEYLQFSKIMESIEVSSGNDKITDSIYIVLKEFYPHSNFIDNVEKVYNKYEHLKKGKKAPNFKGISFEGKEYSLKDFNDSVLFIDLWATWCFPCIKGFPSVIDLQEKFKDKDVAFLFITRDDDFNISKEFLKKHPNLRGVQLKSINPDFITDYKLIGVPRYIIIDKNGKFIKSNASSTNEWEALINEALIN